jgi:hypothetical protein
MVLRAMVGLGAGLLLLSACGWEMSRTAMSDDTAIDRHIASVRVASDSGDVKIHTGDRVAVHRTVRYDRDKPGATQHVDGDVLVIDSCPVRNCSIDYDVTVPAGTAIDGAVDSGSISVDGAASVNLKVDSGDVTANGVSGKINVIVQSGAVRLSDVGGAVTVRSESGDVTVDGARDAVSVQAQSGAIRLTVPRGAYRVSTGTDSGEVHSDVTDDPAGTRRLDLRTESGDIELRYA